MADPNRADIRVQVLVSSDTANGRFTDAIYYSTAEYEALSDAEVDAAKQARVDAWVEMIAASDSGREPEPTP